MCNLAIGVLARIAPQLNVLAVSFSITILVGALVFLAALPFITTYLQDSIVGGVTLFVR